MSEYKHDKNGAQVAGTIFGGLGLMYATIGIVAVGTAPIAGTALIIGGSVTTLWGWD